jgi:aldehyde oxidoreductase
MRKPDGSYRNYAEMTAGHIPTKYVGVHDFPLNEDNPHDENTGNGAMGADLCYAAFVSEVEVEVATGKVKVAAIHCVADVGTVTNYNSLDGQAYSGMEHSIGYALSENYADMDKHANIAGSGFPYIDMIPDGDNFTAEYTETPREYGPAGAGGASECFQSSGHAAILNAIYNAVGVRIQTLPATPDKVKKALEEKKNGTYKLQEKYYLGDEFYETLDYMRANPVKSGSPTIV